MKRYDLSHYDDWVDTEPEQKWVKSEVAEALYNALREYHDRVGASFVGTELRDSARKALSLADGEE